MKLARPENGKELNERRKQKETRRSSPKVIAEWPVSEIEKAMKEGPKWPPFNMPASEEAKKKDVEQLKQLINIPEGWEIDYDVRGMLFYDLGYKVYAEKKKIMVRCYSYHYPWNFEEYVEGMCAKIREEMGW